MKKTQHKIPSSLFKTRVDNAVKEHLKVQVISPDQHDALRSELNKATGQIDNLTLEVAASKQQLSEQAKRHQARVTELKDHIERQAQQILPVITSVEASIHSGLLVNNWKSGWKWLSNWMFILIGYISVYGIPPEIVSLIPEASQGKVTTILAIIGFLTRFINQSKPKPLMPVQGDADV
ncbi:MULTISPECIES: DUF7940 domain-containing protein [Acinetobacter]|uniref:Holin of 3TMs, for gene-transfer release n=1 Tax=Acinetobacter ursingii TaxID=108980 RepID=A0A7T9UH78_9GAMM|nr:MULTISPECIES: hypothetical protein [Acinetobacter]ENX48780.1 hypothetical protein F943_02317 [Acinetobacter ursingii NIPH 706]EXD37921.1 hypothetical protein J500_0382 [Acinetobacter sp. 479375]MCH2014683.1 hypothetical protein [Acinetobacter ursingii]MCU4587427.1 hypothetical protein [Acinetobacter ursingii]QQT85804.1 hypothetical protein I6I53_13015 [Acinetobacter ursingii]